MKEPLDNLKHVPFTCTLDCGSRCMLIAEVRDGRLERIDTSPTHPDTINVPRVVPCVRGRAQRRLQIAAERVLYPLRRVGPRGSGQFREIGWDEALDSVAERLDAIRREHGAAAILHATGAGSISGRGISGAAASGRFFSYWGSVTQTTGNESYHCAEVAARWMLGEVIPASDRATLLDSRLIVMWGMNPAETWMGPNTAHFVARARDRGARVILIDPRFTDSGVLADQWIPIKPGTDAALAAAVAYVLASENLVDDEFVASHTAGYPAYLDYVLGKNDGVAKTPEWAEPITGISAGTIRQFAREFGSTKPAALLPGWGPQRTRHGEQIARAWITLACMTGNVGLRGGGLASVGTRPNAIALERLPLGPHHPARAVSATAWATSILDPSFSPPLKAAYIVASNLINRSPNTHVNARALEQLDFVVVNEPFLTPTARYADIVLPICTDLERSDLVTSWGHDVHLFYSQASVSPAGASRTDYWVFARLAERLGLGKAYTQGKTEQEWIDWILESADLDGKALREAGHVRFDGEPRVALGDFRRDPAANPLKTPSGRVEIVCPQAERVGLPAIPSYVPETNPHKGTYPLQVLTPHSKLRSNSCAHANAWLKQLETHAVWIHPSDAEARGVENGETVVVTSPSGSTTLPAKITERIMPGIICIYQGTWYQPDESGLDRAGCANVLTSHEHSPTGGLATHTTWVEVTKTE
jgi:anaerobic dimethyl sulfoxide reductase subunit A